MNHSPTPETIKRFRFEANRSRGYDKEFIALVANGMYELSSDNELRKMTSDLFMGRDFDHIVNRLKQLQPTFNNIEVESEVI